MIILLGSSGYVGSAFRELFDRKSIPYHGLSRRQVDYTNRSALTAFLRDAKPTFLINAAGHTGKPNVDACELQKADCLLGNAVLPGIIRDACDTCSLPWGHVSTGCIYTGARVGGAGFTELDTPNFCFRTNNCSFYSGCKAVGEECLQGSQQTYIWRLRIPFNHVDSARNYVSKLMRYHRLLDATNSLSHLNEFVAACCETWHRRVPFGTYNITNPGAISTREVVELIRRELKPNRSFGFFEDETEFMSVAAKAPRSNCTMDSSKLLATGIPMTPVAEAMIHSLRHWVPEIQFPESTQENQHSALAERKHRPMGFAFL